MSVFEAHSPRDSQPACMQKEQHGDSTARDFYSYCENNSTEEYSALKVFNSVSFSVFGIIRAVVGAIHVPRLKLLQLGVCPIGDSVKQV